MQININVNEKGKANIIIIRQMLAQVAEPHGVQVQYLMFQSHRNLMSVPMGQGAGAGTSDWVSWAPLTPLGLFKASSAV